MTGGMPGFAQVAVASSNLIGFSTVLSHIDRELLWVEGHL